jgi:mono/diheme cytochrome c family protein
MLTFQKAKGKRQKAKRRRVYPISSFAFYLLPFSFFIIGCRHDMHDQPKYQPLEASDFFADGRASRPLPPGTVARGELNEDAHLYAGKSGNKFADTLPFAVSQAVLARGQERFKIFCSPCHGRLGNGEGMVVRRGFRHPPSFHIDRLRQAPVGYYFDVITNGFGSMQDYSAQIPVKDRWAIIAYVRALQLSQHATLGDVPEAERKQLER